MTPLTSRHNDILKAVVQAHIHSGEPVGSRVLCQARGLEVSPATVRNAMAELEELGYLHQPHASAGRIPTEQGFRHYVDVLVELAPLSAHDQDRIREACAQGGEEMEEVLGAVSRVLASLTQCASLVLPPRVEEALLREVRFLGLPDGRVLALLLSAGGQVQSRLFQVEQACSEGELADYGRELTRRLEGMTLREVRASLQSELAEARARAQRLRHRLLTSLIAATGQWGGLIVNGRTHLMRFPELAAASRLEEILSALEDKQKLIHVLDRCLAAEGVRLFMGAETTLGQESGCAVVAARFPGPARQPWGSLGLLGPMRLDYAQVIPLVRFTAGVLGEMLGASAATPHRDSVEVDPS